MDNEAEDFLYTAGCIHKNGPHCCRPLLFKQGFNLIDHDLFLLCFLTGNKR
jgi:hypothetical protein